MADVVLFAAGIEPGNVASVRCAAAAGLLPDRAEPDREGFVYHVRRRAPAQRGQPASRSRRA